MAAVDHLSQLQFDLADKKPLKPEPKTSVWDLTERQYQAKQRLNRSLG